MDHRGKTFGYASRRVILVGQVDDYNSGPDALNNTFVVESRPNWEELNPEDYDYEDVIEVLADKKWNNKFWVIMSIQKIQLKDSNMQFHLHWK